MRMWVWVLMRVWVRRVEINRGWRSMRVWVRVCVLVWVCVLMRVLVRVVVLLLFVGGGGDINGWGNSVSMD